MRLIYTFALTLFVSLVSSLVVSAKETTSSYNFTRGIEEFKNGNVQEALKFFNKELEENSKNGYAHMAIASIHMDNSEYGDARNAVEAAIKLLPKKDKGSLSRAHMLRGQLYGIERDTVAAYSELGTAIQLDSNNEDAYEHRGQLYYEQKRYDKAEADYRKLLKLNPGGVMGRMGLGRNSYARKDYTSAIDQYDKVISLHPDYAQGYAFRAEALLANGEYVKAMDDICKALEIDSDPKAYHLMFDFPKDQLPLVITKLKALSTKNPYTGEYLYYTAQLYNKYRMFVASNEALEKAFDIDARGFILEGIADNYSEMGDYKNAVTYIDRAIQMNSEDDDLIAKRADILGNSGDVEEAIAQWGEYIDKNPDFYGGYYRRGFFEDNSGKTEDALKDYDMAIMLAPEYAYAYFGRGDMLERLGRHDEALDAYRKVVELDTLPDDSSCAMYALLALGRRDEAVAFMDKVIATDSIDPGNYYDAACFTCRLGEKDKALEYLRTAFEKGFRRFDQTRRDDDLLELRELPEFEEMINEYESKTREEQRTLSEDKDSGMVGLERVELSFKPAGGVLEVGCSINELPLKFIFDTGASIVSLSQLEANFMMKNGYLKNSDVVGTGKFIDANGDISAGTIINLRELELGGLILENVRASVVRNQKAPLLLGQSVLGRLGKIEIDNENKKLVIWPN